MKFICKFCDKGFEDKNLAFLHVIIEHSDEPKIRNLAAEFDKILKKTDKIMGKWHS